MSTTVEPSMGVANSSLVPYSAVARHVQTAVVSVLLITAFWPILTSMYGSWFDEHAYMEHGVLVIPAAAYMAWTIRDQLMQAPRDPSVWGITLLFWGAVQATLSLAAHWIWVSRTSFL